MHPVENIREALRVNWRPHIRLPGIIIIGFLVMLLGSCQTPPSRQIREEPVAMPEAKPKIQPGAVIEPKVEPAAISTHPLLPYERHVLDNGMRIIIKEVRSAPIVAVDIWVGTGAAHEQDHEIGISHFLEHMFFKGTEKRPSGQMDLEIKSLGGYNNAATSYDYTHYYVVLPSEHYLKALDILSDAVLNSIFPEDEIERERDVVYREIDRKEDSPWGKLYTDFLERVFEGIPYGRPILGTKESLAPMNREWFLDYARRMYQPGNLVLVIVGDVDAAEALASAKEIFGSLPAGALMEAEPFEVPQRETPHEFKILKDVQGAYLVVGYPTPPLRGTPDEYALDVAASILGDGRSSWLYQILKEEMGLVTDVNAFFWSLQRAGLFGLETAFEADDLPQVERVLFEQVERLKRGEFTDADIQKAKNQIVASFAFGTEKAASIAGTFGQFEVTSTIEDAVNYTDRIMQVTREEIVEAAQRHLNPNGYTKGFLRSNPSS